MSTTGPAAGATAETPGPAAGATVAAHPQRGARAGHRRRAGRGGAPGDEPLGPAQRARAVRRGGVPGRDDPRRGECGRPVQGGRAEARRRAGAGRLPGEVGAAAGLRPRRSRRTANGSSASAGDGGLAAGDRSARRDADRHGRSRSGATCSPTSTSIPGSASRRWRRVAWRRPATSTAPGAGTRPASARRSSWAVAEASGPATTWRGVQQGRPPRQGLGGGPGDDRPPAPPRHRRRRGDGRAPRDRRRLAQDGLSRPDGRLRRLRRPLARPSRPDQPSRRPAAVDDDGPLGRDDGPGRPARDPPAALREARLDRRGRARAEPADHADDRRQLAGPGRQAARRPAVDGLDLPARLRRGRRPDPLAPRPRPYPVAPRRPPISRSPARASRRSPGGSPSTSGRRPTAPTAWPAPS